MKIVVLDLLCWAGYIGGEHYEVSIRCGEEKCSPLCYNMSKKQAKMFREKDEADGWGGTHVYKAGDYSLKTWAEVGLILEGDDLNPSKPVWCYSDETKKELKKLWVKAEALYAKTCDPFARFPKETDELWAKWNVLIKQIKTDTFAESTRKIV